LFTLTLKAGLVAAVAQVELPIHLRFMQATMEKRNADIALASSEVMLLDPSKHSSNRVPRVFKQRNVQAKDSDDPYWYGDSPQHGPTPAGRADQELSLSAQELSDGTEETLEGPLAKKENKFISIAFLPGKTAVQKLEYHNQTRGHVLRRRDTFGLDVLESTGRDQVLDVLYALQPPELMEDLHHLSRKQLKKALKPHELAIHLHKPSPRCLELRKSVEAKSFLAGIHPKDTSALRVLAEQQFWPVDLIRAGFVYQLCSLCTRQSGECSFSRECAEQMARINAVLAWDPGDDIETINRMREEYAQKTLDKLLMCEIRNGGANAPWPYELQVLLQIPAFAEELTKAGVHSLRDWGAKIVNSLHAIPLFAAVEDLPEETRDQLAKKNRFRNHLNELVSMLRNDDIYYEEFHDRIAKLADKRRGTRPTLSDPLEIGGMQIMIRQKNSYADRVYDTQLGDDWLDSTDTHWNSDKLNLWTPGMVREPPLLLAPFYVYSNASSFYQDRLGTNIGKALLIKKEWLVFP
jgi:hypothetical protein